MIKVSDKIGTTFVDYTPAFYRRAVRNYKNGDYKDMIAMFEQTELDSIVMGCLEGREDGYKRDWRVTEASASAQDKTVKEFVESVFMEINMRDLFDDIFDARKKLYSVIDYNWQVVNGKQIIRPEKINQKYFRRDPKDKILKVDWGNDLREIPIDAALICESRKVPLLIPVSRDFILKEVGIESMASYLETFGEPFIIGKYPPGADADFIASVEAAVKALAMSSRGTMPEGTTIEIIESKRNTADHAGFIKIAKEGIAVTILGHENAVSTQPGLQVGENEAPYRASRAKTKADIFFIEENIRRVIKLLVQKNFGGVTTFPIFTIDKTEPINADERLKVIDSAYNKGYKIAADEFALLGLKKADDQDEWLVRDFNNPADGLF